MRQYQKQHGLVQTFFIKSKIYVTFFIALIISFAAVIIYGLINNQAKHNPPKYMRAILITGIILIPLVGLAQGTFYSHGFDIHWFLFGLFNFLVIVITAITLIGIMKLTKKIKKSKKVKKSLSDLGL